MKSNSRFSSESRTGSLPVPPIRPNRLAARSTDQARRVSYVAAICFVPLFASAQITAVSSDRPIAVFAGRPEFVPAAFRNQSNETAAVDLRVQVRQISSGSIMSIEDAHFWKRLRLDPNQVVLETYSNTFPNVRAPTLFRLEWIGIGHTDVMVYPDDVLKKLSTLAGEQPIAVLDPDNKLRPALERAKVSFADWNNVESESRLGLLWSSSKELPEAFKKHVKNGMALVWLRPAERLSYALRLGTGTVVVANADNVSSLADSINSQLNLIRFAELALDSEAFRLPEDQKETE